jgi:hypothetical protein
MISWAAKNLWPLGGGSPSGLSCFACIKTEISSAVNPSNSAVCVTLSRAGKRITFNTDCSFVKFLCIVRGTNHKKCSGAIARRAKTIAGEGFLSRFLVSLPVPQRDWRGA